MTRDLVFSKKRVLVENPFRNLNYVTYVNLDLTCTILGSTPYYKLEWVKMTSTRQPLMLLAAAGLRRFRKGGSK